MPHTKLCYHYPSPETVVLCHKPPQPFPQQGYIEQDQPSNPQTPLHLGMTNPIPGHQIIMGTLPPEPHKKSLCNCSIRLVTDTGITWTDIKYVGMEDRTLLINVSLSPFDKYCRFHPANRRCTRSTTLSHTPLALKDAPKGNPKYVIGKFATLHPRIAANTGIVATSPTGISSDFAKFTRRPETALKHNNTHLKYLIRSTSASQKISASST
ncbi:hypothetical protein CsSME_00011692 [Camellia sinensis var. sinensis]